MIIKNIELKNYRNYHHEILEFDSETNILYGDNAQGKTNILEAIYMCSTTKSHQGSKDRDIIQMGQEESHIRMNLIKNQVEHKIDMHLKISKPKGVAIDGLSIKKSSELLGICNVIVFSPEDLQIIKSGPSERRRFMDMELCQLNRYYMHQLTKYKKVLNQRNILLKQIGYRPELMETIQVWNQQLVECGYSIIEMREQFVNELNEVIKEIHYRLTGKKETLHIDYVPNCKRDDFENQLNASLEKDIQYKMTHVGPHRDDLVFISNDIDLKIYGSQGQKRTAALSLKLAEIDIVKKRTKDTPILLLDDVLSELDRNRQNHLLESIKGLQTIITCTGLEEFITSGIPVKKVYQIVNGSIKI